MIIYPPKVLGKSPVRFSTTPLASLVGLNKQVKMPKMAFYILWKNKTDLYMIVGSFLLIFELGKIGKNGYISAPEPKLKKLRALDFLQLSKFEETKCP